MHIRSLFPSLLPGVAPVSPKKVALDGSTTIVCNSYFVWNAIYNSTIVCNSTIYCPKVGRWSIPKGKSNLFCTRCRS